MSRINSKNDQKVLYYQHHAVTKNINWETDPSKSYHCQGIQRSNYLVIENDEKILREIDEMN